MSSILHKITHATAILAIGLAPSFALAHNKVVVIPLAGDDVATSFAVFDDGNEIFNIGNTAEVHRTISIKAPVNGVVIVSYVVSVDENEALQENICSISTDESIATNFEQIWSSGAATGRYEAVMSGTRGFNVSRGSVFEVNLVCRNISGGTSKYSRSSLTAILASNIPN